VVRLDQPSPGIKIHVQPIGGSARLGEDWTGGFQVLYAAAGATSVPFSVEVVADTIPECDEGVVIQYWALDSGDEKMKEAHLVIEDDDGGPRDPAQCAPLFAPAAIADAGAPDTGKPPKGSQPDAGSVDAAAVEPTQSTSGCSVGAGRPGTLAALAGMVALWGVLTRRRRARVARGRS
jgi:hypothetical protein